MRARGLDLFHRLEEIEPVAIMLLDPRRDREDVGVEDDVFGREADSGQQLVGARADLDLALLGVRLAGLVEGHHHGGRAVVHAQTRVGQEFLLAFLHRDRVNDRLARDALQARLDHMPLRAVDHHRHARDVGLGTDQLEEGGHRVNRVEQALVHVDVDHLRAVFDLLARDFDRGRVVAVHDQLLEPGGAGHVGPLADIDEVGDILLGHDLSPVQIAGENDIVVQRAADIEASRADLAKSLFGVKADGALIIVLHAE